MPKSDLHLHAGDYSPVADRITLFYEAFPTGRIITELLSHDRGRMIVRALVYRDARDTAPAATGLAAEREDDGEINAVACLENTETSAIGRALANLGFTASRQRPSLEEMAKADRARRKLGFRAVPGVAEAALESARYRTATPGQPPPENARLQAHSNAVTDVLRLLDVAVRLGFDERRAARIREPLIRGDVPRSGTAKLERLLRGWLRSRDGTRFPLSDNAGW